MSATTMAGDRGGSVQPWLGGGGLRLLVAALLVVPAERAPAGVQALVLVAMGAGAWLVGDSLAAWFLGGVGARDRRFGAAVLGIAVWVVVGAVIGHLGLLTGAWFRGVVGALVVVSAFVPGARAGTESLVRWGARRGAPPAEGYPVRARRGRLRAGGSPPPGAPHVVASASQRRGFDLGRVPLRLRRLQRAVLWTAMVVVLLVFARTVIRYRHAPPGRFNYDDTSYHLTAVATWNVHHDLRMPRFTFGDPRTSFYPFASELLAWELTTPFGGGDFAARWVELPFALLTLVGVTLVARRVGAGEVALLAPLLYATVSEVWPTMALTAGNDHALAFATVATVHGALLLWRRPRWGAGVYAGAGLGLLLATKYLGVIFAPLLVALAVIGVMGARRDGRWRQRLAALGAVVIGAAVVGGYAYLRNAV